MIKTLLPAYGRDYKRKADILSDLNNNKDFLLSDYTCAPINKDQLVEYGYHQIVVRYGDLRKVTSFKLTKEGSFK